jgi:CYTH domain-containing protein
MASEIERKFLVKKEVWEEIKKPEPFDILQGYLTNEKEKTIRVRIKNKTAFLTIKGATEGITRQEFEYEIPLTDAQLLLKNFCSKFINKKRYEIEHQGQLWEVDEFEHPNKGLILAEIELKHEAEKIVLPKWVDKEVSDNPEYFNSNMLK